MSTFLRSRRRLRRQLSHTPEMIIRWPGDAKAVFTRYRVAKGQELLALEFEQLLALLAIQMVVLRIAVVMFVYGAPIKLELLQ